MQEVQIGLSNVSRRRQTTLNFQRLLPCNEERRHFTVMNVDKNTQWWKNSLTCNKQRGNISDIIIFWSDLFKS
jgi:hypothetical protein